MEERIYNQIRDMFAEVEKQSIIRHNFIAENIAAIRKQQDVSMTDRKEINEKIHQLFLLEAKHFTDCPVAPQIPLIFKKIQENKDATDEDLIDYNFYRRNPKIRVQSLAVSVLIVIGSIIGVGSGVYVFAEGLVANTVKRVEAIEKNEAKKTEETRTPTWRGTTPTDTKKADATKDAIYQEEINEMNK